MGWVSAWRSWLAWRAMVRACPHPQDAHRGRLIELGTDKAWWCDRCGGFLGRANSFRPYDRTRYPETLASTKDS